MITHETGLFARILGKTCRALTDSSKSAGVSTLPQADPFIHSCAAAARAEMASLEATDSGFGQLAVSLKDPGQGKGLTKGRSKASIPLAFISYMAARLVPSSPLG